MTDSVDAQRADRVEIEVPVPVPPQRAEVLCVICNRSRDFHKNDGVLHEFAPEGGPMRLVRASQSTPSDTGGNRPETPGTPPTITSDAILRLALLRKGIITTDDLDQIETELRVTGVAAYDPGRISNS